MSPVAAPARRVAGLLLAAGAGRRLGSPKALVLFDGEPLVLRAHRLLRAGGCDPVVTVLGARADDARAAATAAGEPLTDVVVARDWQTGMGASLRAGLVALAERGAAGCVIALVDQPAIGVGAIERLRDAWEAGAVAAVATYGGRPQNPVLLDRTVWAAVAKQARGDSGARAWLRTNPELVVVVPCDDSGSADDMDTPADLERLAQATIPKESR